jgi:hypothetical protein
MNVGSVLSAGLQGVQAGLSQANAAAGEIARSGTTAGSDGADLTTSLVKLKSGELQTKAAAAVVKTADQLVGTLIDIRA